MKKIFFILGILIILFILVSIAAIFYTERPQFCISCHIMKPYYNSWKESAHKDVNCLECHYEPSLGAHVKGKIDGLAQVVQYLTKRYSGRPNAQVSDASCLREGCHSKEKLKDKKIAFKNKVTFNHAAHFNTLRGDIELRCTSCHMQLTNDKHIAVEGSPCFICHFKGVAKDKLVEECAKCHSEIQETASHKEYLASGSTCFDCHSDAKKGEGSVREQVCYFCHSDKEKVEKIKDFKLLHEKHIHENKVDCISCHDIIEHNVSD